MLLTGFEEFCWSHLCVLAVSFSVSRRTAAAARAELKHLLIPVIRTEQDTQDTTRSTSLIYRENAVQEFEIREKLKTINSELVKNKQTLYGTITFNYKVDNSYRGTAWKKIYVFYEIRIRK